MAAKLHFPVDVFERRLKMLMLCQGFLMRAIHEQHNEAWGQVPVSHLSTNSKHKNSCSLVNVCVGNGRIDHEVTEGKRQLL